MLREFFANHPDRRENLRTLANKQWCDEVLRVWRRQKTKEQWTDTFRLIRKASYNKTYLQKALSVLHSLYETRGKINQNEYEHMRVTTRDRNLIRYETIRRRFFEDDEHLFRQAIVNYNHKIKK